MKIKMLVNDIARNRTRVKEIIHRFVQAGDDKDMRLWVIENLAKEELVSESQRVKLVEEIEAMDIKRLSDIIKEAKIGQGLEFLPRKTEVLIDTLQQMLQELVDHGGAALKEKILPYLNELLHRKEISVKRYDELKEQNDIV